MPDVLTARCPLCRARGIAPTSRTLQSGNVVRAFSYVCSHCGLLLDEPAIMLDPTQSDTLFRDLCARKPTMSHPGDPFGCDIYTMRTIATRFALAAMPANTMQAHELCYPHGTFSAEAHLKPLPTLLPTPVSVGIMCSEREASAVLAMAALYRSWADAVIVLIDRAGEPSVPRQEGDDGFVSVFSHPLDGHFANQRNALQALCGAPWMFQLDADEDISPELGESLTRLATLADRQGAASIGLPRQNLVDGRLSDLYPDVQYRLNRREVVYEGIVHERPVRSWQTSFIALSGAIRHHLTAEHVARRSKGYEQLQPGGGRLFEEDALQRPFSAV
ncbi:hypothetical protein [Rhizobium sp. 9140]|uniref:hypothetical protein n=1 Tax=Rhizobium sp. 9140 TaxID=1761900 RepID=UPI00079BF948|nr:hypothetical protein [Rhizobium sp. 9140]CZT37419.1 hypothetical protein GA0004734_00043620 [Rhizobium sp. 9140]